MIKTNKEMREETDCFARCLLMPKHIFVEVFDKLEYVNSRLSGKDKINTISYLSSIFDVPVKQVMKTIEELELKL